MPPPGLHSLILYDNFEWKTAQKSHENLQNICDLTRIPAISLEEFETEFYGVLKDNYHGKLIFRNLAKIDNLKICIISDILAGKSIEKSYKDMSEVFGAGNIDFLDMDFWYYRFYNGNYDLDYDRRLYSEPLKFLNLPMILHQKIIDNLDWDNILTLRKVSKSLKNIVDQGEPAMKMMDISFFFDQISLQTDDFSPRDLDFSIVDYRKDLLNRIMIILNNPRLRLDSLDIDFSPSPDPTFIDFFKNLKHKILTKRLSLHVNCPEDANLLLACMKPKFLKKLSLRKGNIEEIVKLDQWKYLDEVSFSANYSGPIDHFLGFSEFRISLPELTEEHLVKLKEGVSKSQNFESCHIRFQKRIRPGLIEKVFSLVSSPEYRDDENNVNFRSKMPPPGLHSLILYDNFEWKTAQKSHENLQNIGDLAKIPAISLEEFETEFYGILKENYHGKLNFRNLAKIDNLKLCILSDVLAGKSIENSFTDLSETFGAENIDFLDMDFWYYRFYNGDYDLDYDRSFDSKPLEFLNLPMIIHHKIIDNLDSKNHLTLRIVSNGLRNMVDQGKPAIKHLSIQYKPHYIRVRIDNVSAWYSEDLGVDYRKIALNYVLIILKNPKLRLRTLHIGSTSSIDPFFIDFFNNLKHKISTKYLELNVDCPEATNLFLTCLKPKFLEKIILMKGNIDEIVKLDQWKSLKTALCSPIFSGLIDNFLGFTEFVITVPELTEEHLMKIKEELSKSEIFESCHIFLGNFEVPYELIMSVFDPNSGLEYVYDEDDMPQLVYSYSIPNSRNFLNFTLSFGDLKIVMHRSS
ncbi:hypothetical protein B9Z55_026896 [Caenorhabditis nigoni]|uniref:F-box domain-containing protein n=1 Tax=Caenorhabditis nigoni TaxID=1611254 RepID=A0A2G5SIC8_9PELO|nr:hypothetical protein B9Z55_026896 [Caenorhabditis nigoni]